MESKPNSKMKKSCTLNSCVSVPYQYGQYWNLNLIEETCGPQKYLDQSCRRGTDEYYSRRMPTDLYKIILILVLINTFSLNTNNVKLNKKYKFIYSKS